MADRWRLAVMISAVIAAVAIATSAAKLAGAPAPAPMADVPTYSKDVAPILQNNCQVCHRPGEAGPISLLTYQRARPCDQGDQGSVVAGKMPPWFADPHYGKFSNSMSLSAAEIDTISEWVDGGAPEGDPRDLPKPAEWVEGWDIGKPDMVFELPLPFEVPARGVVDYQHIIVPTQLHRRPLDPGGGSASDRTHGRAPRHRVRPRAEIEVVPRPAGRRLLHGAEGQHGRRDEAGALPSDFLVGYAPGQPAEILRPGQAKLVKAGSDIVFQLHYTPHGHALTDRSHLGIVFAKTTAERARADAVGRQRHVQDSAG